MKPEAEKNLKCIFEKLRNTIEAYKAVYPELMYLEQELKKANLGEITPDDQLNQLLAVNTWLKAFIMQYYIFRTISYRLDQDLAILQQEISPRPDELYLEFSLA